MEGRILPRLHIRDCAVEDAMHQVAADRGEEHDVVNLRVDAMALKLKPGEHRLTQRLCCGLIENIGRIYFLEDRFHPIGGGLHLRRLDRLVEQVERKVGAAQQVGFDDLRPLLRGIFYPSNLGGHVHKGLRQPDGHFVLKQQCLLEREQLAVDGDAIAVDVLAGRLFLPTQLDNLFI